MRPYNPRMACSACLLKFVVLAGPTCNRKNEKYLVWGIPPEGQKFSNMGFRTILKKFENFQVPSKMTKNFFVPKMFPVYRNVEKICLKFTYFLKFMYHKISYMASRNVYVLIGDQTFWKSNLPMNRVYISRISRKPCVQPLANFAFQWILESNIIKLYKIVIFTHERIISMKKLRLALSLRSLARICVICIIYVP